MSDEPLDLDTVPWPWWLAFLATTVVVGSLLFLLGAAFFDRLTDDPLLVQSIETDDGTACIVLLSGSEPRGLDCWGPG